MEEQGEDFRLAHAELLDAYHAMEAENGTDEERRKQFAKDLEDYAHKCQLAEKPCDANAFNVGWLAHEAKAESGRVEEHKPMTHLDGRRIEGLLRCENCGLSQTYWERWPSCPASHSQPSVKEK